MRKVIVFTNISLDGFIAGPHDDITWVIADRELHEAAIDLLKTADTVLYGRKTYQMMRDYWPTAPQNPSLPEYEVAFANVLNPLQKIVFSTTLETTDWNTTIRRAFHPEEIKQLKQEEGKHIVLGGATIAQQCMQHGLIDEIRLVVHPVVLGSGKPLFKDVSTKLKLLPNTAPESPCDSCMGMKSAFLIWGQGKRGNTCGFSALDNRCLDAVY